MSRRRGNPNIITVGDRRDRLETPSKYWGELYWKRHDAEQRRIREPLGEPSVVQPTHVLGGFALNPKRRGPRDARSKGIDAVLEKLGIR